MQKMKDTPEAGGNVLDNTVLVHRGGRSRHAAQRWQQPERHSVENMAMLVVGHAGGLVTGQHIRTSRAHPAQALITAMQAAGYTGDTLGEVAGNIPDLITSKTRDEQVVFVAHIMYRSRATLPVWRSRRRR